VSRNTRNISNNHRVAQIVAIIIFLIAEIIKNTNILIITVIKSSLSYMLFCHFSYEGLGASVTMLVLAEEYHET